MRCRLSRVRSRRLGDGDAKRGDGVRRVRLHRPLHREPSGQEGFRRAGGRARHRARAVPQADGRRRADCPAIRIAHSRTDRASRGGGCRSRRQCGGHSERAAIRGFPAHPGRRGRARGTPRGSRRRGAPRAHLGDRRGPSRRQPIRRHQRHRRGNAARSLRRRHDFAAVTRIRPGGHAVQPLRRDGADAARDAGDLRRYAVSAGLCRRCRGRSDGRAGASRCRRSDLRTRRPARVAVPRVARLRPSGNRAKASDGRCAHGARAIAGAHHGTTPGQAADPRSIADAAA